MPGTYPDSVRRAMNVFQYQVVYDFEVDALCPCSPYPPDFADHGNYAGEYPFHISQLCRLLFSFLPVVSIHMRTYVDCQME